MQDTSRKQRKQAETINKNCQKQGRLNLGGQWERCECFHPIGGLTSRCSRTEESKPATCFSHFHQYKHASLVSLHGEYCFSELSFSLWKKSTPEVLLKVWRQGKYSINQNQESSWYFTHLTRRERKHTAGPACTVPSAIRTQKLSGWAGQMAVSILVSFLLLIKQNTDRKQLMGGKEGLSSDNSRSQSTVAQKLKGQELKVASHILQSRAKNNASRHDCLDLLSTVQDSLCKDGCRH